MASAYSLLGRREIGNLSDEICRKVTRDSEALIRRLTNTKRLEGHQGCVNTVCWNTSGSRILSGSDDRHLKVYDAGTKREIISIVTSHPSNIFSARFVGGDWYGDIRTVSCAGAGSVEYSETTPTGRTISGVFNCHRSITYQVAVPPTDGNEFMTCEEKGLVRRYDLRVKSQCPCDGCNKDVVYSFPTSVSSMAVHPVCPYYLVVGLGDGTMQLLDRRMVHMFRDTYSVRPQPIQTFSSGCNARKITCVQFNEDGSQLLASYSEDNVYLFNSGLFDSGGDRMRVLDSRNVGKREAAFVSEACGSAEVEAEVDRSGSPRDVQAMKKIRFRGDWSDTGPEAQPSTRHPLVTHMSQWFDAWLNEAATEHRVAPESQPEERRGAGRWRSWLERRRQARRERERQQLEEAQQPSEDECRMSDAEQQRTSDMEQQKTSDMEQQRTSDMEQKRTSNIKQQRNSDLEQQRNSNIKQQRTSDMEQQRTSDMEQQRTSDLEQQRTSDMEQQRTSNTKQQSKRTLDDNSSDSFQLSNEEASDGAHTASGRAESLQNGGSGSNEDSRCEVKGTKRDDGDGAMDDSEESPNRRTRGKDGGQVARGDSNGDCPKGTEEGEVRAGSSTATSATSRVPEIVLTEEGSCSLAVQQECCSSDCSRNQPVAPSETIFTLPLSSDSSLAASSFPSTPSSTSSTASKFPSTASTSSATSTSSTTSTSSIAAAAVTNPALSATASCDGSVRLSYGAESECQARWSHPCAGGTIKPFMRYKGHRNARTMIKQANFFGDRWVLSGSDCGRVFVWDKWSGDIVNLFLADSHVVNCIQPHPSAHIIATSGVDYDVKLWEPVADGPCSLEGLSEIIERNRVMLEESRNTITMPPMMLVRLLPYLSRRWRMSNRNTEGDTESTGDGQESGDSSS